MHSHSPAALQFRDYQFIYGTSYKLPTSFANAVSKMDVKNGSSKQWYEANCLTTEPLMLPKPGATEEVPPILNLFLSSASTQDGSQHVVVRSRPLCGWFITFRAFNDTESKSRCDSIRPVKCTLVSKTTSELKLL